MCSLAQLCITAKSCSFTFMMRKFLYAPTFYYSFINMSMNFLTVNSNTSLLERLVPI